jgi:hypothetical protein
MHKRIFSNHIKRGRKGTKDYKHSIDFDNSSEQGAYSFRGNNLPQVTAAGHLALRKKKTRQFGELKDDALRIYKSSKVHISGCRHTQLNQC